MLRWVRGPITRRTGRCRSDQGSGRRLVRAQTSLGSGGSTHMSGALYAAAAGVGFGVFQAFNRRANQKMDGFRATFVLLLVGTVCLVGFNLLTQDLSILGSAPWWAFLAFVAAGVIHFSAGWTFLTLSQQSAGAATTGAVLASTPLVGSLLAALVLGEALSPISVVGIVCVMAGVGMLSLRRGSDGLRGKVPWFALAAATCWGASPLFIRWGLNGVDVPLLGVAIGLLAGTVAQGIVVLVRTRLAGENPVNRHVSTWIVPAGITVAMSIAFQWTAFDLITVAVAITVMQVSAPTVLVLAPIVVGGELERPDLAMVTGSAAVIAGSVIVVLAG